MSVCVFCTCEILSARRNDAKVRGVLSVNALGAVLGKTGNA